jgi:hypothetical protein
MNTWPRCVPSGTSRPIVRRALRLVLRRHRATAADPAAAPSDRLRRAFTGGLPPDSPGGERGWYGWELDPEQTAAALVALREAGERYERPAGLGDLEITITPSGTIDAGMVRRYADVGVHRLVLQPPTSAGSAVDEFIESVGGALTP